MATGEVLGLGKFEQWPLGVNRTGTRLLRPTKVVIAVAAVIVAKAVAMVAAMMAIAIAMTLVAAGVEGSSLRPLTTRTTFVSLTSWSRSPSVKMIKGRRPLSWWTLEMRGSSRLFRRGWSERS